MKNDKISIVVPVYNAEKYVHRCINSLMSQTYRNIEIILIDDGSKDNSYAICKDYAKVDSRVRVYTQKNAGPSAARNKGLELASGDYIAFVDSDDYVEKNIYEVLIHDLKEYNADLAVIGMQKVYSDSEKYLYYPGLQSHLLDKEEIERVFFDNNYVTFAPVDKLYPRHIIGETRFDESIKMCEDQKFVYEILKRVNKVYYNAAIKYNIDVTDNSLSRAKATRYHLSMLQVNEYIIQDTTNDWMKNKGRAYNAEVCLSCFVPYYHNGEFTEDDINYVKRIIRENTKEVLLYGHKKTKVKLCLFYLSPKLLGKILLRKRQGN